MKVKTSITISESLLSIIDRLCSQSKSRSEFIENALRSHLQQLSRNEQESRDLTIINDRADELNEEATDVLDYQANL